ncbi:hypothetical protein K402DRAFT_130739 [Aulographum hederae CBS 113979]|uniref:Uncharacterized protein n=1 Tax=Aulographum hederae CBS 113979 TaxID=1176131 RepID=A0A6G1HF61_9PEZI|nr:hypothetical protein K402DRAFT_130739 [Aulographum hederae CBS 113979]
MSRTRTGKGRESKRHREPGTSKTSLPAPIPEPIQGPLRLFRNITVIRLCDWCCAENSSATVQNNPPLLPNIGPALCHDNGMVRKLGDSHCWTQGLPCSDRPSSPMRLASVCCTLQTTFHQKPETRNIPGVQDSKSATRRFGLARDCLLRAPRHD